MGAFCINFFIKSPIFNHIIFSTKMFHEPCASRPQFCTFLVEDHPNLIVIANKECTRYVHVTYVLVATVCHTLTLEKVVVGHDMAHEMLLLISA